MVYDIRCRVDILLGYNWLAAHYLHFLYKSAQVSFCVQKGYPNPQLLVCVDVASAVQAPPSASVLMNLRELWC